MEAAFSGFTMAKSREVMWACAWAIYNSWHNKIRSYELRTKASFLDYDLDREFKINDR